MDGTGSHPGEPVSEYQSHGDQPEDSKRVVPEIDVRMRRECFDVRDAAPVGDTSDDEKRDDRRERSDDGQLDGLNEATSPWTFSSALRNAQIDVSRPKGRDRKDQPKRSAGWISQSCRAPLEAFAALPPPG